MTETVKAIRSYPRTAALLISTLFIVFSSTAPASAQMTEFQLPPGQQSGGSLKFGPGYSRIGGESFISFNIEPELAFGKIGVGLSIPLLISTDTWQIRKIDWDSSRDYTRLIRYIRYGVKRDPVYVRVGELSNTLFGHGFVVYYYNNALDDNYPKRGVQLDLDFGKFGFESLIGNLGRPELYGGRGYVRPLRFLQAPVPIIKNFAVGLTYITDRDSQLQEPLSIVGFDLEQPLLHNDMIDLYIYFDWSSISDWDETGLEREYGSGSAYGVATDIRGIAGLFALGAKFEMRNLSKGFTSGLIGPLYDVNKNDILYELQYQDKSKGWYGEIAGNVIGKIGIRGSYFQTGKDSDMGDQFILHADATNVIPVFSAQAYFVKQNIQEGGDLFKLDENAFTIAEIGYKLNPFTRVLMRYEWSYVLDDMGQYITQKRIEPRVEFSWGW
ncbi:MAG: hypothetical protein KAT18_08475 [Candidatus Latescibacteria bacterium]|nr:hypothetical protein [Candidatus Latescibacterota bacterium]